MYFNGKKILQIVQVVGADPADATATSNEVLAGKTFYAGDSLKKTGTIETYIGNTEITQNGIIETAGKFMINNFNINVKGGGQETKPIYNAGLTFKTGFGTKTELRTTLNLITPIIEIDSVIE